MSLYLWVVNKKEDLSMVHVAMLLRMLRQEDTEFKVNLIYTQASLIYKARFCQRKSEEGREEGRKWGGRKRKHSDNPDAWEGKKGRSEI